MYKEKKGGEIGRERKGGHQEMGRATNHIHSEDSAKRVPTSRSAFEAHMSLDKKKGNEIIKPDNVITIKSSESYCLKISASEAWIVSPTQKQFFFLFVIFLFNYANPQRSKHGVPMKCNVVNHDI